MRSEIIKILLENKDEFVSGEYISEKLGITRSAVSKHIKNIKNQGYDIESITRKGHKIIECPDLLSESIVKHDLNTKFIGKEVIHFDTTESTNDYAKKVAVESIDGTIVVSEDQTKGRGRRGRQWHSIKGEGIWLSIILKPDIYPHKAPFITQIAGASIVKALKKLKIDASIKWPNDIIVNNKKISGILTELGAEIDRVNYIVLGIGINVKTVDFPEDIKSIATSIFKEGYNVKRIDILKNILEEFEVLYLDYIQKNDKSSCIKICKENSAILGKNIYIINNDKKRKVKCIDINEAGNLVIINEDNDIEELIAGEVSIRGERDYI
ncbi:MAG: biotin--[acetyl-CoA-carboxylase] ligase [Tepidibacter sp.]|jgi:BirA family biotin operon repressor/biotin-[acetyl-CoA-carboxylase] ligase|uniref:biotin--[acetyl-CoA-carboxylase] ligase n=1 Tax=Tepidibacter sp. TaxID=2529387 RepID=UPI0025FA8FC1|nr:biotin--[acetyl-CoA-carboxylase] ligase [Tepidibacter sp.]MCT4509023.1 biotin--[acetyl-CoA-carboxylase] ligase [Tepidibacter sp.]